MSITTEVRKDLIALVVGVYGAAPGTALLSTLANTYNANPNMAAVALSLQSSAPFIAAYPSFMTNTEFATRVVDNILQGRVAAADRTWAIDTLVASLNSGAGRAELILTAVIELQKTTSPDWANAKAAFANKVDVATYHTVTLQKDGTLAERAAVIANVDQTAASAESAKVAQGGQAATDAAETVTLTASAAAANAAATKLTAAQTAVTAATNADAAVTAAQTAKTDADTKAALTDAAALATASTTAADAAAAAVTAKTDADADVVAKTTALTTAIASGDVAAINVANAQKLIAEAAAVTAATNVTTTAAAAATAATAATAAAADDAAATAAATAVTDAIAASATASAAAKAAAAEAVTAANASVTAAAATTATADDLVAAQAVVDAAAALTSANASGAVAAAAQKVIDDAAAATAAAAAEAAAAAATAAAAAAAAAATAAAAAAAEAARVATNQTLALTTGVDTLIGAAGDDIFVALQTGAADETLGVADTIVGGAGNDTLNITLTENSVLNYATVSGVENISIRSTITQADAAANAVDMANFAGATSLTADRTVGANNISNIALTTALTVSNLSATADQTFTWAAAGVTGAANATTVTLAGAAAGADIALVGAIESVTLNVTAATSLADLDLDAGTTSLTVNAGANLTVATTFTNAEVASLTVTGSGNVSLPALDASTRTVSATSATGNLTLIAGAVTEATNPGTVDIADITINTGSGNDSVNLTAVDTAREIAVNTGDGNDLITIGTVLVTSGTTTAGDVINGGGGTDTLAGTSAVLDDFTTAITTVSGIEILRVTDALAGTITPANIQAGLNTVLLSDGANGGRINFPAGANIVNIAAANVGALTLGDTGTATTDSVTINNTATANADMGNGQDLTVVGLETVNIVSTNRTGTTSQGFGAISITADTGGTATLNLSGTNAVTTGVITARVVDASGLTAKATGTATFTMGAAMVGGTTNTITGSAGDDTLVGDANDTTNINGGAGNDTITGGSDAETINGGAGNDTINGGGGADIINGNEGNDQITLNGTGATVDGGDGNDTVIAAGNLLFGSAIIGGAGTDTLSTNAAVSSANGSTVSGFEVLTLATAGTTDLDNFANNTFTTVNLSGAGAETVQSVRAEVIQLGGALAGDATITMESATGTADSITVRLSSAAAFDTGSEIVIAGVETINIVSNDTNTTPHQNTIQLTVAAATSLIVSGNAGVSFAGSGDISKAVTMDASGVVLSAATATGVTYAATYNTVGGVTTITGSNGIDILTGGSNTNDTIIGGAGADTLVYTGGTDVITGGAGADTFDVNAVSTTAGLTIADATVGDIIDLAGLMGAAANVDYNATQFAARKITLGSSATLTNYLDSSAAGDGATGTEILSWFNFGGNTYIVVDNTAGSTFTAATDSVIVLTGTINLATSVVVDSVLTIG